MKLRYKGWYHVIPNQKVIEILPYVQQGQQGITYLAKIKEGKTILPLTR